MASGIRIVALSLSVSLAFALRAAVVQHVVLTSSDPATTIKVNLGQYANATADAAAQGAEIVVFPEFGLGQATANCNNNTAITPFCEPVPYTIGQSPCQSNFAGAPIQHTASCLASQYGLYVAINTCERASDGRNYNAEIVYEATTGAMVAKYRKIHPWYQTCFAVPDQPDLTMFNMSSTFGGGQLGVMTCFDIIFPTPGPVLASPPYNIRTFVYSASIPMIGSGVQALWSSTHGAVLLASNLALGESGIWKNGTRITPVPASQGQAVLVADI